VKENNNFWVGNYEIVFSASNGHDHCGAVAGTSSIRRFSRWKPDGRTTQGCKRCAVSAGMPIAKDGSWSGGTPEQLAKYQACKAKNNIN
jgi:hypothetical protein